MKKVLLFIFLFSFWVFSCSPITKQHTGEEGEKCYPDNSCDKGLKCVDGATDKFCENPC